MTPRVLLVTSLVLVACPQPPVELASTLPPSAARLTMECETRSVFAWDADRNLVPGNRVRCVVHVGDRFGTPLSGTHVQLFTEGGSFSVAEGTTDGGTFETELIVGLPEPINVDAGVFAFAADAGELNPADLPPWMSPRQWPIAGPSLAMREPSRADPLRPGSGDNNPRDHLVTLIAVVEGEEAFSDDNANSFRDQNEAFVDLTEPFVDADDDGLRGPREAFVDGNGTDSWDGKNGSWDSMARVWTRAHVLWTGIPNALDVSRGGGSVIPWDTLRVVCSGFPCTSNRSQVLPVSIADPWLNGIAGTRCRVLPVDSRIAASLYFGDWPGPEVPIAFTFGLEIQDARLSPAPPGTVEQLTVQLHCDFTDGVGTTRSIEFTGVEVELH